MSAEWPPETLREALPTFLELHETHRDWTGWLGWYAVRVDQGEPLLCGSVGFKGPPDTAGTVELGYSVLPSQQGAGIATEMVARACGVGDSPEWRAMHRSRDHAGQRRLDSRARAQQVSEGRLRARGRVGPVLLP